METDVLGNKAVRFNEDRCMLGNKAVRFNENRCMLMMYVI